jgi:hypothetical protein
MLDDGLAGLSQNGGFEQVHDGEPLGWSKFGGEMFASDQPLHGRWAAGLRSAGGSTKWIYQLITVKPGDWYAAGGFARIETGNGEAFLRLSWYASADGDGATIDTADSPAATSEEWAALSVPAVQAPPNAASVRLRLMLRAGDAATAAFDDVVLRAATAPPPAAATPIVPLREPAAAIARGGVASPIHTPTLSVTVASFDLSATVPALRISEILANPEEAGRDSAFEWVELLNTTALPLNTAGWKLGDSSQLDPLPAMTIPAGGYVVVAAKSAALPPAILVVRVADGEIGAGLGNSGDAVRLVAPDGTLADAVSYGDNVTIFANPPKEPAEGQTLGIRDPGAGSDSRNWAATLRPTPGEPNEFPAATPTAKKGASGSAPRGTPGPASLAPLTVERGAREASVVPSILVAVAAGAGALASVQLGAASLPKLRKKPRHDR